MSGREAEGSENIAAEIVLKSAAGATGGAVGGLFGLVVAGPLGAVGGATLGNALGPPLESLAQALRRSLRQREDNRTVTILDSARARYANNLRANLPLRADGVFQASGEYQSEADALFEAVLRRAQEEFEERKIRFQGNLLGNIPFHAEVDVAQAQVLVRLAAEASYRQYCLLALFMRPDDFSFVCRDVLTPEERNLWDRLSADGQAYAGQNRMGEQQWKALSALISTHHAYVTRSSSFTHEA